jgi:hypothetical protein
MRASDAMLFTLWANGLVGWADGGWAGLAATALLDTALPVFNRDTP